MNRNLPKTVRIAFFLLMTAAFLPIAVLADSIGNSTPAASTTRLASLSRTVVVCDSDVVNCNAKSPENDFEGFVTFYSSMHGLRSPSQPAGADTLILQAGAALSALVTDGFPRNTVFINASALGNATYQGFTLIEPATGPPIPTPEPSAILLAECGLLCLGLSTRRLQRTV
jgi:hypothetical protein